MISVVLLRGVNVGGHRLIKMANLREWLRDAGFTGVETYIQSGNALLEHCPTCDVSSVIHDVIYDASGLDVPVISRTASEFMDITAANPFGTAETSHLHVSLLAQPPDVATVVAFSQHDWQREEFRVVGRNIFLHLPEGFAMSPLVAKLALVKNATTRNWKTILALEAMLTARA